MDTIYLDHAATTPIHPEVIKTMSEVMEESFGNPSSIHGFGRHARALLDESRRYLARSIGADEKEVYFTSGGTEADNIALIGVAQANKNKGKHIITTQIEHHGILHAAEHLEAIGFEVTYLPVDAYGQVDIEMFKKHLREDTILVSIMMINNETGAIQPIKQIATLLESHQAYFHTDAVQAYGLKPINVTDLGVDLMSITAHKFNGPKGVGFLYAKQGVKFTALSHGGAQERLKRAGTENLPAIVGMKRAIEVIEENNYLNFERYKQYNEQFYTQLKAACEFVVNGQYDNQSPTILNVSFPNTNVESLLMNLDLEGVAASSGSACTAGSLQSSHVLVAMYGADDPRTQNSIRFSFGLANNQDQMIEAATRVARVVNRLTKK